MAKVVTITNPVTGQPAQVDQLDHTAQQIDDAVEAARWSHRNLLDNAYFANPDAIIDQRGGWIAKPNTAIYTDTALTNPDSGGYLGGYTKVTYINETYCRLEWSPPKYVKTSNCVRGYTGVGYGIDRWKSVNNYCTILVGESGISISASGGTAFFRQIIDNPEEYYGRVVTISTLTADGKLYTATGTVPKIAGSSYINVALATITSGNAIHMVLVLDSDGSIHLQFRIGNGLSVTVSAAKLELGTVQTLAHQDENGNWVLNDPPPDKGMELAKCQRYLYAINTEGNPYQAIGIGSASSSTLAHIVIPIPVKMRAFPTLITNGSFALFENGMLTPISASNFEILRGTMQGMLEINVTATGLTVGGMYVLAVNSDAAARLFFDANL